MSDHLPETTAVETTPDETTESPQVRTRYERICAAILIGWGSPALFLAIFAASMASGTEHALTGSSDAYLPVFVLMATYLGAPAWLAGALLLARRVERRFGKSRR
jgi:hypothetical protein